MQGSKFKILRGLNVRLSLVNKCHGHFDHVFILTTDFVNQLLISGRFLPCVLGLLICNLNEVPIVQIRLILMKYQNKQVNTSHKTY